MNDWPICRICGMPIPPRHYSLHQAACEADRWKASWEGELDWIPTPIVPPATWEALLLLPELAVREAKP